MTADTLILGNIITLDHKKSHAKAVTVEDGRITYVGSEKTARTLCDEFTQILDYGEEFIYPGFMDPHTHPAGAALLLANSLQLTGENGEAESSMEKYVEKVAAYIAEHPDDAIYRGMGWSFIPPGPNAAMLDAVCKDKPVYLVSFDGHSIWLNTAAMKECGIDKEFAKRYTPEQVHVDENGEPTGLVAELEIMNYIQQKTRLTVEETKHGLLVWQDFAFSQGITAVGDAGFLDYATMLKAMDELIREGKWKLRTYCSFALDPKNKVDFQVFLAKGISRFCTDDHFKINSIKLFLDGVVEGHTAWTIDEYKDQPGYRGFCALKDETEKLTEFIKAAEKKGLFVHCHSIGDAATKFALDCIEEAALEAHHYNQHNCLAHLQLVRREDFQRFADLNVVALVPPLWTGIAPAMHELELSYLGEERVRNEYPIKSFIDAGAVICFHSDYPVSPLMSVPGSIYTAVYRKFPWNEAAKKPEEGITVEQALDAMTKNVAYLWHEEDNLGTIEPGKVANFAVYDRNFLIDIENPQDVRLIATIVDGDVVFAANEGACGN